MNLYRIFFCSLFIPKSPMRTRASLGKKMPARAKGKAQGKAKAKAQPAAKRQRTCAPEGTIGLAHAGMGSLQRHRIMKPEVDEDLKFKNDLQQFKNDLKEFKLELAAVDEELKQLWARAEDENKNESAEWEAYAWVRLAEEMPAVGGHEEEVEEEAAVSMEGVQDLKDLLNDLIEVEQRRLLTLEAELQASGHAPCGEQPAIGFGVVMQEKEQAIAGPKKGETLPGVVSNEWTESRPMQVRPIPVPTGAWKHLEVPGGFIHKG